MTTLKNVLLIVSLLDMNNEPFEMVLKQKNAHFVRHKGGL